MISSIGLNFEIMHSDSRKRISNSDYCQICVEDMLTNKSFLAES